MTQQPRPLPRYGAQSRNNTNDSSYIVKRISCIHLVGVGRLRKDNPPAGRGKKNRLVVHFLAAPESTAGTRHLPPHVPRFSGRRTCEPLDDADTSAAGTVANVVRFGSQVNVADGIDFQFTFTTSGR